MEQCSTTTCQVAGPRRDSHRAIDVLRLGDKAGPWIVERVLGRGGMGMVYAVTHERIGKRAALKLLHRGLLAPLGNADRMVREAQIVNRIAHPNIVDIFESGTTEDGRPYIVMERLDGVSLREHGNDLTVPQALSILLQVCDALIAAHDADVVHRDLKPENIFVVDDGDQSRVKLLDWGIARVVAHEGRDPEPQLVGTPQYLAPERARGAPVTPASDVYSLGVVAYELLLGRLPFDGTTVVEVMTQHVRAPVPDPRAVWPEIPAVLDTLLRAMLAKEPAHRPTMPAVRRALRSQLARLETKRSLRHRLHALIARRLVRRDRG